MTPASPHGGDLTSSSDLSTESSDSSLDSLSDDTWAWLDFGVEISHSIAMMLAWGLSVALLIATLATALHALRSRREVSATLAWIGLIFLSPLIGLLLYWAFGVNRVARRAKRLRESTEFTTQPARRDPFRPLTASGVTDPSGANRNPPADVARYLTAGDRLSRLPISAIGTIRVHVTGTEAYAAMLSAIARARRRIWLASYWFASDHTGHVFTDALAAAQARGVEVRVLVDAIGVLHRNPTTRGLGGFASIVKRLRRSGITVARFNPLHPPKRFAILHLRSHRKLLIVDDDRLFIGGMNLHDGHAQEHVRDLMLEIHDRSTAPERTPFSRAHNGGRNDVGSTDAAISRQPPDTASRIDSEPNQQDETAVPKATNLPGQTSAQTLSSRKPSGQDGFELDALRQNNLEQNSPGRKVLEQAASALHPQRMLLRSAELIFAEDWAFATHQTLKRLDAPVMGSMRAHRHSGNTYSEPGSVETGPAMTADSSASASRSTTRATPDFASLSWTRLLPDGPDEDFEVLSLIRVAALQSAQSNVQIITPYFLPDASLMAALKACAIRGVRVEVFIPARSDHRIVDWAARPALEELIERGVLVWQTPAPFLHAKLMCVDQRWALLGSSNWDPRSLRLNFELDIEIAGGAVLDSLSRWVDRERRQSRPLVLEELRNASNLTRLRDAIARLPSPYL